MSRLLLLLLLLAPASSFAGEVVLETFEAWADKAVDELRLDGAPGPHRVTIATLELESYEATAVFGALQGEGGARSRPTKVEVVVGGDSLDSARFSPAGRGRAQSPWRRLSLVVEDVPIAIERDLWMATDAGYKGALQQLGKKAAAMAALGGDTPPADWSAAPAVRSVQRADHAPLDRTALAALAADSSARLRDLPGLNQGDVRVRAVQGHYVLATSEGTALVQPEGYVVVHALAGARRADGLQLEDERQWIAATPADLPSAEEIAASVEALGRSVLARAAGEEVAYYEGPVVFEGEAAAAFLRFLLPTQLRGTPPPKKANSTWTQQTRSGPRVGRKLLPDGWSVVDDPAAFRQGEAGAYVHDREGVAASPVTLVEDGYVRDLLMTRVPRDTLTASNGRARGLVQSDWEARMTAWSVTPAKNLPAARFDRELKKAWTAGGQDRVLVVRRLKRGKEGSLPMPTDAVWRTADGKEEPALALQFQQTDRRTLRDIAAAGGGSQRWAYLAGWRPKDTGGRERGVPCVLEAPAQLLVLNLELVYPGPGKKPFSYPPPDRSAAK